eukprot:1336335-Pyramimonas_sp.AAC.1
MGDRDRSKSPHERLDEMRDALTAVDPKQNDEEPLAGRDRSRSPHRLEGAQIGGQGKGKGAGKDSILGKGSGQTHETQDHVGPSDVLPPRMTPTDQLRAHGIVEGAGSGKSSGKGSGGKGNTDIDENDPACVLQNTVQSILDN